MFASPDTPLTPRFRLDAWAPDYVGSLDLEEEEPLDADRFEIDTAVETDDWSAPPLIATVPRPACIYFVDGVQRVEVWGRVEGEGQPIEAALASVAVGAAISREGRAEITFEQPLRVHRVLAIGGAANLPPMTLRAGRLDLRFEPEPAARPGRAGVSQALGNARARYERAFAESLTGDDSLVVQDGRLSFDPGPAYQVVGMAKTIHLNYLAGRPENAILSLLGPGQRTPVFRIHYGETTRYSWYLRLPNTRAIHHSMAGIIRLETPEIGSTAAVRLANLTACHLPAFASRPEHDPRAPQNLLPIGALEKRLRHEMGDSLWLRRSIEDYLFALERNP